MFFRCRQGNFRKTERRPDDPDAQRRDTADLGGLTHQQRHEKRQRQERGQALPDLKRGAFV